MTHIMKLRKRTEEHEVFVCPICGRVVWWVYSEGKLQVKRAGNANVTHFGSTVNENLVWREPLPEPVEEDPRLVVFSDFLKTLEPKK